MQRFQRFYKSILLVVTTLIVTACGGEPGVPGVSSGPNLGVPPGGSSSITISGTVTGASGATLTLTSYSDPNFSPRTTTTDSSGAYSFSGLSSATSLYGLMPTLDGYYFTPGAYYVFVENGSAVAVGVLDGTKVLSNQVNFYVNAGASPNGISAIADSTAQTLTVGTAMSNFVPLLASGGTAPYTFSYTGTLPAGLSFNTNTGVVSGTPTATYTPADVVFSVKDANNVVATTTSAVSFTVLAGS